MEKTLVSIAPHDSSLVSCASDIIIVGRRPARPPRCAERRAQYAALEAMDEDEARRAQQRERARQTLQAAFLQLYQVRACVARARGVNTSHHAIANLCNNH